MSETSAASGATVVDEALDLQVPLEIGLCKACGICIELCPEKVFDRDKLGRTRWSRAPRTAPVSALRAALPGLRARDQAAARKKKAARPPAVEPEQLATVSEPCSHDGEEG